MENLVNSIKDSLNFNVAEDVLKLLMSSCNVDGVDMTTLPSVLIKCMQTVADQKTLTNEQKKQVVQLTLEHTVLSKIENPEIRNLMQQAIDHLIDVFYTLSRDAFIFGAQQVKSLCCPCWK